MLVFVFVLVIVLVLSETVLLLIIESTVTDYLFDHDRLDVCCLSIEYVSNAFDTSQSLEWFHRHSRDQWLRAAQSGPLSIAEGNGKQSLKEKNRFFKICLWLSFGVCCNSRYTHFVQGDRFRIEPDWKNQFETDRVDVNSVDPANGYGIRGIERVRVPRC